MTGRPNATPAAPLTARTEPVRPPGGTRPTRAMVLAAGRGERLRPLTDTVPKPLVTIADRALIDHALDRLAASGVEAAVVNTCWLAEAIETHLAARDRPAIAISREETALDTGGGVARALDRLGPAPFFVVNADALWLDGPVAMLDRLAAAWDDAAMDALLLLVSAPLAIGMEGPRAELADYFADGDGQLHRRRESAVAPYYFAGVQILHPRLFDGAPAGAFPVNRLWNRAEEAGRLYGLVHDGAWFHVGTPAALEEVRGLLDPHFVRWVEP
ncbi:MAG: nucleotidyltransferase family protein [Azospirillaceae bacterium]